jgi:hypothetical protein
MSFYGHGPVLMSKDLVAALVECGVDNLQTYDVIIKSSKGADSENYLAVNIVGAIAAADMEKSLVLDAPDGPSATVIFERLVIDETKACGQLVFRLGQSLSTILIEERVVHRLEEIGLTFTRPSEFAG